MAELNKMNMEVTKMTTYKKGYGIEPIIFDLENYSSYLYNEYLQGCVYREVRVPSKKEIEEFIATGKASHDMLCFVKAMREVADEFNQDAYIEMEMEEMMANMPPEQW